MSIILDKKWFDRLGTISSIVDDVEWLQNFSRITKEERDLFLSNEIENPEFQHKKATNVHEGEVKIEEFLVDIEKEEKDAIVLDLYRHKLEKQRLRSTLIRASQEQNDELFYQTSIGLYGKPKKKYFAYVAKQVTKLADAHMESHPAVAKRLKKVMSKIDITDVDISADILPPVVTDVVEIKDHHRAVEIFQSTLDRLEITGWTIQVDQTKSRPRFSVSAGQRVIHIPSTEQLLSRPKNLTDVKLQALAEHEIGVHARRAFEGSRSGLLLLQTGLDSYLSGEEGLAGYSQQQIEGAEEFYGFDRYLAVSLAVGMDGIVRDFRSVFSIMTDYYTLRYDASKGEKAPIRAAWDVCVRTFRGTTGLVPGTAYTKDIAYMEGNIGIWHLISDKPHVFESLFLGKYNPLIQRHIKSLQTLEILKEW